MPELARSTAQRTQDALHRLENDVDAWVATADAGAPYLVPLSFWWDGASLLISTPAASPTGRNLQATGRVRLGIGPTRDLLLVEGLVETLTEADLPAGAAEAFVAKTDFDPRRQTNLYLFFRIRPRRVQAWREVNELADRDLMRDGEWLAGRAESDR